MSQPPQRLACVGTVHPLHVLLQPPPAAALPPSFPSLTLTARATPLPRGRSPPAPPCDGRRPLRRRMPLPAPPCQRRGGCSRRCRCRYRRRCRCRCRRRGRCRYRRRHCRQCRTHCTTLGCAARQSLPPPPPYRRGTPTLHVGFRDGERRHARREQTPLPAARGRPTGVTPASPPTSAGRGGRQRHCRQIWWSSSTAWSAGRGGDGAPRSPAGGLTHPRRRPACRRGDRPALGVRHSGRKDWCSSTCVAPENRNLILTAQVETKRVRAV